MPEKNSNGDTETNSENGSDPILWIICVCIYIAMNKLLNFEGYVDFEVITNIKCQHSLKYPG